MSGSLDYIKIAASTGKPQQPKPEGKPEVPRPAKESEEEKIDASNKIKRA
jgi:hypothetical protein